MNAKGSNGLNHFVLNNYNVVVYYILKLTFQLSLDSDCGGRLLDVCCFSLQWGNKPLPAPVHGNLSTTTEKKQCDQPHKNTCSNFAIIDSNRRYIYGLSEDKLHMTSAVSNCLTFLALLGRRASVWIRTDQRPKVSNFIRASSETSRINFLKLATTAS
jgi:hypothetical protein